MCETDSEDREGPIQQVIRAGRCHPHPTTTNNNRKMKTWMICMMMLPELLHSQEPLNIRLDERLRVEYAVRYNLRFDRGRLDRPYRGSLTLTGNGSYFNMSPLLDSATQATDDNEVFIGSDTVMQVWKDFGKDSLVFMDLTLSGRPVPYADTLHPMGWKLLPDHRVVEGLECHRAETWFRGRKYVAWYAPSIPLPHGPWKLGGLPGLVVEAYDEERNLTFRMSALEGEDPLLRFAPRMPSPHGDYAAYRRYWQDSFRRLKRSMAAQSDAGCLTCQTQTKVAFHTWEKMPE